METNFLHLLKMFASETWKTIPAPLQGLKKIQSPFLGPYCLVLMCACCKLVVVTFLYIQCKKIEHLNNRYVKIGHYMFVSFLLIEI